jgi:hypothetical protein
VKYVRQHVSSPIRDNGCTRELVLEIDIKLCWVNLILACYVSDINLTLYEAQIEITDCHSNDSPTEHL